MRITVRVHGDLSSTGGGTEETIELPDGSTALDVLGTLNYRHPSLLDAHGRLLPDVNVLVNGRSMRGLDRSETVLQEGDRLHILRAFGGG